MYFVNWHFHFSGFLFASKTPNYDYELKPPFYPAGYIILRQSLILYRSHGVFHFSEFDTLCADRGHILPNGDVCISKYMSVNYQNEDIQPRLSCQGK